MPCLLVLGINIAHSLTHSAMAMGTVFMLRRGLSEDMPLCPACLLCICVGRYVRTYGAEGHFNFCTQGRNVAKCTKQGRAAVILRVVPCAIFLAFIISPPISSPSLPTWLICQSLTTVAPFPLSPLFFFTFFLFSLLPVLQLWCCELLIIYLPAFFSLLPSLLFAALLQSVSLFYPWLFPPRCLFPSASFSFSASMFLCVNSWDAFVEGFHSDGPFEQVVIHVCSL